MPVTFHQAESRFRLRGKRRIAAWVEHCIAAEGLAAGDISFIFCSPEYHLEVNRRYLGHDYRTDVITFDYRDHGSKTLSGDIFIDPGTVTANARLYHSTAREEMLRVIIHGILHLCGYGDKTPAEQKIMRGKENDCLREWSED